MISPHTTVGPVALIVKDLDSQKGFYESVLGLKLLRYDTHRASLGTADGNVLVELVQYPKAPNPGKRVPGLFHLALLLPTREALGRSLENVNRSGWKLTGAGDHLVSEALYLDDPEGNGIELYSDRPRDEWTFHSGFVQMDTLPVNFASLVSEAKSDPSPWEGVPDGTTMGHVHLKVSGLEKAKCFYEDVIGFSLMASMPQAYFLAAGCYHHHIGINSWLSSAAEAPPVGSLGLSGFSINVPTQAEHDAVRARISDNGVESEETDNGLLLRDPSGNAMWIRVSE